MAPIYYREPTSMHLLKLKWHLLLVVVWVNWSWSIVLQHAFHLHSMTDILNGYFHECKCPSRCLGCSMVRTAALPGGCARTERVRGLSFGFNSNPLSNHMDRLLAGTVTNLKCGTNVGNFSSCHPDRSILLMRYCLRSCSLAHWGVPQLDLSLIRALPWTPPTKGEWG